MIFVWMRGKGGHLMIFLWMRGGGAFNDVCVDSMTCVLGN